jgi:hypothetical protein
MEFTYLKAPNYYIDGVPGYKAGEWPGIKSCKFANTRRIIHPKDQGIIFNEHDSSLYSRKRLLGPGPSPEYVFRPSIKMVTAETDRVPRISSIKPIKQQVTIAKMENEKRHKFEYLEEKKRTQFERERNLTMSNFVRNEMKLLIEGGMGKKKYDNLGNRELFGLTFNKKGRNKLEIITKEEYGLLNKQQNVKDRKRDINYVNSLTEWDSKTLSKFSKSNNNNNNNNGNANGVN